MIHQTSSFRAYPECTPPVLQVSGANLTVGTAVLTALGEQAAEDLKPGDLIVTKDFGLQKLQYVAFQDIDLTIFPDMAPIKTDSQHLGLVQGSYFAPTTRFSVRHPMFEVMFGNPEVLVKCGDLINISGFKTITDITSITYIALGFERRNVISCNGARVDIGLPSDKISRTALGAEDANLAMQLLRPRQVQAKRHSLPLH